MRILARIGAVGVMVTLVLASRERFHDFARRVLSEQELSDALLLGAAALVVLPLAPDRPIDPWGVLNPRTLWRLVVLVIPIGSAGYVAVRVLGARRGLPLAGLAGGYASTVLTPVWSQDMIAGRGWIAVALVVFGTWRPARIVVGAYLFGAVSLLGLALQALGIGIPSQLMTCMPYVLTIVVLVVISADKVRIRLNAPASLGENYRPTT